MRKCMLDALIKISMPALTAIGAFQDSPDHGPKMDTTNMTMVFARELEHITTEMVAAEYPELMCRRLLALAPGVDPADESFTWTESDKVGLAILIANYADQLPDVELRGKQNTTKIESIGIQFSYSVHDVKRAARLNRPLDAEKAISAREEAERRLDELTAFGDEDLNIPGFITSTSIPLISSGLNGDWANKTAAQILDDMNAIVLAVTKQSIGRHLANRFLVSLDQWGIISTKRISDLQPSETVLSTFRKMNPGVTVEMWNLLTDSAEDGVRDRIICYNDDPRNVQMVAPLDYERQPPQAFGLNFRVPGYCRGGGTIVKRPLSAVMADNC